MKSFFLWLVIIRNFIIKMCPHSRRELRYIFIKWARLLFIITSAKEINLKFNNEKDLFRNGQLYVHTRYIFSKNLIDICGSIRYYFTFSSVIYCLLNITANHSNQEGSIITNSLFKPHWSVFFFSHWGI